MRKTALLVTVLAGLVLAPAGRVQAFSLPDHASVVFLGDILTEQGMYADAVETFVRVAYPQNQSRFCRFGRDGATPESLLRLFEREVVAVEPPPTHVVICVGLHYVNMREITERELKDFDAKLRELVSSIEDLGMEVVLVTPPSADENRNVRLQALSFNEKTLGPIAAAVRDVGQYYDTGVVDWYSASMEDRRRRQATDPNFSFSQDGLRPQAEGHALLAALLLEHWDAEPMRATITLDWATGAASTDRGSVSAQKVGDDAVELALQNFPLPWVLPSTYREPVTSEWYAMRLCRFDLRVDGLPKPAAILEGRQQSTPLVREQLAEGFNLAVSGVLNQAPEAVRLLQLIEIKNRLFVQCWLDKQAKRPNDEELMDAYKTLISAYEKYHDGYVRIIERTPRQLNLSMVLRAVDAAGREGSRVRRPKVVRPQEPEGQSGRPDVSKPGDRKGSGVVPRAPD
jgi:hypothetical protein